jgi:cytoskeleton protein RodZ
VTTLEAHSDTASVPSVAGPGARLRAARETAGLSLDQAAQQLKLAPRQVKALEEEDFAHLPGRTFTRGFVRNYARLLNLDPEDLLALMPDTSQAPALNAPALHSTGAMIAELPSREERAPGLSRWLIPLVLVACVLAAAGYEWYRGGLPGQDEATRAQAAKAKPADRAKAQPSVGATTPLPNPLAVDSQPAPVSASPTPPIPAASSPPQSASDAAATAAPPVSIAPAAAEPVAPVVEAPAPLQLVYTGPSWTEIRDRDGQLLIARLVPAGSEQAIRGAAPFDIVIGNAAAVTLTYRGKPVDLARYARQNVARLRLS